MCPHNKAQCANCDDRPNHWQIAKDRLAAERGNHVADNAKAGQDDDVHFGVTEEPQDVLVQYRITAACWVKERETKVAVHQQHGDCASQYGQRQKDQPARHEDRPAEQGHLEQGHTRGTHVQESCDHVDRTQNGRSTGYVNREDREIHRHTAFTNGKWWIQYPADTGTGLTVTARRQNRTDSQRGTTDIQPKRQVVHTRERHVGRANLQRHKVVTEATEKGRNNHKEHHQDTVGGDQNVPKMPVWRTCCSAIGDKTRTFQTHVLNTWVHQFQSHVDGKAY